MARIVIFVGDRKSLERFDMAGVPALTPATATYLLPKFAADPNGLLVAGANMATGWRAPKGTFIVFHPSWGYPADEAHTLQALARVPPEDFVE